jgi:cytochrome c-type biogenesis protein CcmH
MTLWISMAVLCLLALLFVVWPLYRSFGGLTPMLATIIVLVVGGSAVLYYKIGQPSIPSGAGSMPDTVEVMASLADRLKENPEDVDGWILLGRSYQSMQQYDEAISAFEKALELEQGRNGATMIALAIALMERQGGVMNERSSSLFENALALEPNNPNALFYAGTAAAHRGDTALAADRWETLAQQDTPPEIREMLQIRINEWRGLPPPQAAAPEPQATNSLVSLNLSLSGEAAAALPANARVFIIARDPNQPSPPIAVIPRQLSDLPVRVDLDDSNAMVQGRPLSAFAEFEVVARVSLSGSPAAKTGDWYGSLIVQASSGQAIDLVIDQKVP